MDETLVRERIADILMVLASIAAGSVNERLRSDLDGDDPFTVLYEGINEVVENLVAGQDRLASAQNELEKPDGGTEDARPVDRKHVRSALDASGGPEHARNRL